MAEGAKNNTISKTNSGFPDYLDFDKLRTEAIDYLGKLTGKIWTDYNVHDPGITILEVLCYALLDLGYRTNLPAADIFTPDPEAQPGHRNFFTPARILGCNPFTITDFRKLLIDISGIRNAWLEVDTQNLNGLYHVYLETENELQQEAEKSLIAKVKKTLMARRNLCEDFIDVYILCKTEIGVCADIELQENADVEQVYIAVIERLNRFFSPAPRFYTLKQLLDQQRPIDEIFAGRPYDIINSHGFVDTEELKQITLRREIPLSDVYHAIFNVEGVKGVNDLRLQSCDGDKIIATHAWQYQIAENSVPVFSPRCSGFQFNKKGRRVFIDLERFEGLFAISFAHHGKIEYQTPSPYLDIPVPQGTYHSDLTDYYSVQNEFPRVYGIAAGGLSENASAKRKAEALQLKAWLLFFDQLLANYLAQLKNIPSLFDMSSAAGQAKHSYFINQLTTVPDHQELIRFNLDKDNDNALGAEGTILVFPVEKKKLKNLEEQNKLTRLSLEGLSPYTFATIAERDTAINQLKNDLLYGQYQYAYITKDDTCVFYYIDTSSDKLTLICKKYFKDIAQAKVQATSVPYIGTFDENYRSFITADNTFSFDIELNLLSFSKYLQLIVEDKALFYKRRQGFLNHLLARFAEKFTDYAILAFGFQDSHLIQRNEIRNKENYLSHYDELSSNRGKAYNYLEDGWYDHNVSGFEKKIKALCGIGLQGQRSLCNFVVEKYDELFAVRLHIADTVFFVAKDKFASQDEALQAALSMFLSMKEAAYYRPVFIPYDKNYKLELTYGSDRNAVFPHAFDSEEEAADTAIRLTGLFIQQDPLLAVFISSYIYIPELKDTTGKTIRRSVSVYPSEQQAKTATLKSIKKINDEKQWEYGKSEPRLGSLYHIAQIEDHLSFINIGAFKIDIDNSVIDKPNAFTYELLDRQNSFKFQSASEFKSANSAKKNAQKLLALLTNESNYEIFQEDNKFRIRIVHKGTIEAIASVESNAQEELLRVKEHILRIVKNHQYTIYIDKQPDRWKFHYELGYEKANLHRFESTDAYKEKAEAIQGATFFIQSDTAYQLKSGHGALTITARSKGKKTISVKWINETGGKPSGNTKEAVKKLLDKKKEISRLRKRNEPRDFRSSVSPDETTKQGPYVYRLVNKDHVPAFHTSSFDNKAEAITAINSLFSRFKNANDYLQLCLGGEYLVHKIVDQDTGKHYYHYQVKSLEHFYKKGDLAGKSLVLFESTKGYANAEEAEKAFKENYLYIMHLASDAENYNKTISLKEGPILHSDSYLKSDYLVFIPEATRQELKDQSEDLVKELVTLARRYPIRMVPFGSEAFYQLFPCEEKTTANPSTCNKETQRPVYYFILGPTDTGNWQSTKYYADPEKANEAFKFLLMLLGYPGNYFVDCSFCDRREKETFHIYIREVLAESARRFHSEEAAWSSEGIQKLICMAQSEDPFHTYFRKNDCCYSFYLSCKDSLIYHPCKYDTAERRDKALLSLYQSLKESLKKKAWQIAEAKNNLLLLDESGNAFAAVNGISDNYCRSDLIDNLAENADLQDHYKEKDGRIILTDNDNNVLATAVAENLPLSAWKETLQSFLCLYPIVKRKRDTNARHRYCIEIKLPGFNACNEDIKEDSPCGCGSQEQTAGYDCYLAWKSPCCYENCREAEHDLQIFLKLLQQYDYYQPIFDCVCNSFGISLQFESSVARTTDKIINPRNWQNGEIVAVNPQCYSSREDACEAVGRAKQLINSEGLHLIEHILLRPRCPEDERCSRYHQPCEDQTGCEFLWDIPTSDPCREDEATYLVPGADPYSFIATVVLPAWPERFRKKENRTVMENMIYREAPAHILIRILWLSPRDFCFFETKFKQWNRWLALRTSCMSDFSVCDFLEFLFDRHYECLEPCSGCESCDDDSQQQSPCFSETGQQPDKNEYLNQLNKFYCWAEQDCGRQEDINSNNVEQSSDNDRGSLPEIPAAESENQPHPENSAALAKTKSKAVNTRLTKYRANATAVVEKSQNNPLAVKAKSFIADPKPGYDRLSRLVTEILQNKRPKITGGKILTKNQQEALLKNVISYWLDRYCFNGKQTNELNKLTALKNRLIKAKIIPGKIYDYWNPTEIKPYVSEARENKIKKIFKTRK